MCIKTQLTPVLCRRVRGGQDGHPGHDHHSADGEDRGPGDGEEGLHDTAHQDGQVLRLFLILLPLLLISSTRSGTSSGLSEHFRTVLRELLENLEDSEGTTRYIAISLDNIRHDYINHPQGARLRRAHRDDEAGGPAARLPRIHGTRHPQGGNRTQPNRTQPNLI